MDGVTANCPSSLKNWPILKSLYDGIQRLNSAKKNCFYREQILRKVF